MLIDAQLCNFVAPGIEADSVSVEMLRSWAAQQHLNALTTDSKWWWWSSMGWMLAQSVDSMRPFASASRRCCCQGEL